MNLNALFGSWLKQRRKARGLTQEELAQQIGYSARTIEKIESGERRPSRQAVELLAACFDIPLDERAMFAAFARGVSPVAPPSLLQARAPVHWQVAPRRPNNLPAQLTAFVGREAPLQVLGASLRRESVRLLTLVGPPGIGKTRLSLQAAIDLLDSFADGVFFVALAPTSDPELVASTIAQALGVREQSSQSSIETLKNFLREKQMLLLLDNFEQVVTAAPLVAQLLVAAPALKALVTSREPLHLYGEHEFPVPALTQPDRQALPPIEHLTEYEAVGLFVERAVAAQWDFALTHENAPAVVELCASLDGLPLAIELAAAHVKRFSPQAMVGQLENRLTLLVDGPQDLPARQQTLRGAIDWSYDLLEEEEQALFRRLSVFAGGCTLKVAAAVVGATESEALHGLAALADKSLLRRESAPNREPRFTMLETIREYARECLAQSGEEETLLQQYAHYFLTLAEQAEPELRGLKQLEWLDHLEVEHGNLRAALGSALDRGDAEVVGRLAGALGRFWYIHGHPSEGRRWLELAMTMRPELPTRLRANVLHAVGMLARHQGDNTQAVTGYLESLALFRELEDKQGISKTLRALGDAVRYQGQVEQAIAFLEESLALAREIEDKWGIASTLKILGIMTRHSGDYERAAALYMESLSLYREFGNPSGLADVLNNLGTTVHDQGNHQQAVIYYEEALALFQQLGARQGIAISFTNLGLVACAQGDYEQAAALYAKSLALHRELGNKSYAAYVLNDLGTVAYKQDNYEQAQKNYEESLTLFGDLNDRRGIAESLERLARVAGVQASFERAARLFGAADALRSAIGAHLEPEDRADYDSAVAMVRAQLDERAWAAAWAEGQALSPEQAIAHALNGAQRQPK